MLRENISETLETAVIEKAEHVFEPCPKVMETGAAPTAMTEIIPELVASNGVPDMAAENGRMLARIALMLLVLILLVNVPITSWGASLLQIMPQDITPVAIAEGMVLEDSQGNRYLLHNHRLRHFSSPEAYEQYSRLRGRRVQPVADRIIAQYGHGLPIYHLVQCEAGSIVYALEHGQKRPFSQQPDPPIPYSSASWDQIDLINCQQLEAIATGHPLSD